MNTFLSMKGTKVQKWDKQCVRIIAYSIPLIGLSSRGAQIGEVKRVTKETNVALRINLDGSSIADALGDQLASHGLFDVHVKATGDIHIDDHHTNEDVAIAIGTALLHGLGDRKGINQFGQMGGLRFSTTQKPTVRSLMGRKKAVAVASFM